MMFIWRPQSAVYLRGRRHDTTVHTAFRPGLKSFFLDSCAVSGVSIPGIEMLDQIVRSHVAHTRNSEKPKSAFRHDILGVEQSNGI